jgi:uncharacterized glyoxalase superfamily protein PhnB
MMQATTLSPYLAVRGAERVLEFAKGCFGAVETMAPMRDEAGVLRHVEMRIGDSSLMLGDPGGQFPQSPAALHIYVPDVDAAYARALWAGAESLVAPADREFGDRDATVRDTGGNRWYIATHLGESHRPEGRADVTPCVHPREAAKLIEFLERALGAQVEFRHDGADGTVAFCLLRIGSEGCLAVSDARGIFGPLPSTFHLYVDDVDAWYRRACDEGATAQDEPADQPYGDRRAQVLDPAGHRWYFAQRIG